MKLAKGIRITGDGEERGRWYRYHSHHQNTASLQHWTKTGWRIKLSQKIKINFFFLEDEALMETKQGSKLMVRGISMSSVNFSRLQSRQRGFPPPAQCWTPTTTLHRHRLRCPQDNSARRSQCTFTSPADDLLWSLHRQEGSRGSPTSGSTRWEDGLS